MSDEIKCVECQRPRTMAQARAAYDAIEAAVREQVAAEIIKYRDSYNETGVDPYTGTVPSIMHALTRAARLARGGGQS